MKDTVRAEDSFLGAPLSLIISDCELFTALDKACAIGTLVARKVELTQ